MECPHLYPILIMKNTILKALDMLALALVYKNHRWTKEERTAYEKAVRLHTA